jgi:hypothetical protein
MIEVVLQNKNRGELLRQALTHLSPEHRAVIDLVYYHEKNRRRQQILEVPPAAVKTRMFYARRKLAELVRGHRTGKQAAPQDGFIRWMAAARSRSSCPRRDAHRQPIQARRRPGDGHHVSWPIRILHRRNSITSLFIDSVFIRHGTRPFRQGCCNVFVS